MTTSIEFDPGYGVDPWATLCRTYPGEDVYPSAHFRTEWGPIFHRGRLDGTARILVIGQDPAQHEAVARRILIGEAGQRTQGFLQRLGITHSYVMINTYLYSVYGSAPAQTQAIADYRHQWLNAIHQENQLDAIVSLGSQADHAYRTWIDHARAGRRGRHRLSAHHPSDRARVRCRKRPGQLRGPRQGAARELERRSSGSPPPHHAPRCADSAHPLRRRVSTLGRRRDPVRGSPSRPARLDAQPGSVGRPDGHHAR